MNVVVTAEPAIRVLKGTRPCMRASNHERFAGEVRLFGEVWLDRALRSWSSKRRISTLRTATKKVRRKNVSKNVAIIAYAQNALTPGDTIVDSSHKMIKFCAAVAIESGPTSPSAFAIRKSVAIVGG